MKCIALTSYLQLLMLHMHMQCILEELKHWIYSVLARNHAKYRLYLCLLPVISFAGTEQTPAAVPE